jgi:hypothetical protein
MKVVLKLIVNTLVMLICLVGLHYALITIGSTLAPITDHFKTLTMLYAGILDGEFVGVASIVLIGVGALTTLAQLLIGE